MCHVTTCRKCKKSTWAGCGQHKTQVLAGIPKSQRCQCDKAAAPKAPFRPDGKSAAVQPEEKKGFFGRLFG